MQRVCPLDITACLVDDFLRCCRISTWMEVVSG
jgi:hypothetical protein